MSQVSQSKWKDGLAYDTFLWFVSILVTLFFREIHPRSTWKVPRSGPVIIVAAPHANQFVDPIILMRVLRHDAHRRVSWLMAEKSLKRKFIGFGGRAAGSVSVGRALDKKKPAEGKIYLPDPEGDPTLVRGVGTHFDGNPFMIGGLLVLPSVNNDAASAEIKQVLGPQEIRLKKAFKGGVAMRQLTGQAVRGQNGEVLNGPVEPQRTKGFEGIKFNVAPHVDQSQVYNEVFKKLHEGGCIGIFPEGGSHDRTELLPLKAGVAIMALGALAEDPNCGVKIVPCGMNYFHAHKFRSRAVVEFGSPVEVPTELVDMYKRGERREAVAQLLETVYDALVAVTVTSPDYDTLMLIQAVRRLYSPKGKKLPLPMIVELNRRLVKGYTTYKDYPRIIKLKKSILAYNKALFNLNIRDHQVSYAKLSVPTVVFTLLYRVLKLSVLSIAVLPGTVLFAPVFIAGKVISIKKSREALAASSVKVQAKDVVATWKLLVAMALAPALYTIYTALFTYWTYRNRAGGRMPDWVPLWMIVVFGYTFFPAITFAALRFGEISMDIVKSLRPLVLSLSPRSSNTLAKLRTKRAELVEEVTSVINELGPELFPDFDHQRILTDPNHPLSPHPSRPGTPRQLSHSRANSETLKMTPDTTAHASSTPAASIGGASGQRNARLPRNESFTNLSGIGLFATRPGSPNRSRSRSSTRSGGSGILKAFTSMDTKGGFEAVNQKIRGAMRERGRRRQSEEQAESWDADGDTGATTPGSDVDQLVVEHVKKDV